MSEIAQETMTMESLHDLFVRLGKEDLYDLNRPLLEEAVYLKQQISTLKGIIGDKPVIVHPSRPGVCRQHDAVPTLLRYEDRFSNLMLRINKIVGSGGAAEEDPIERWIREHSDGDRSDE